jgi:hypothetical protein
MFCSLSSVQMKLVWYTRPLSRNRRFQLIQSLFHHFLPCLWNWSLFILLINSSLLSSFLSYESLLHIILMILIVSFFTFDATKLEFIHVRSLDKSIIGPHHRRDLVGTLQVHTLFLNPSTVLMSKCTPSKISFTLSRFFHTVLEISSPLSQCNMIWVIDFLSILMVLARKHSIYKSIFCHHYNDMMKYCLLSSKGVGKMKRQLTCNFPEWVSDNGTTIHLLAH